MKKTIDIEKLLQWAMRDELPKGQAIAASPWDMITQYCALGVRVQTSGHGGDGFGFTPGAPHEDAIIVADAVRALRTDAQFDDAREVAPLFGDLVAIAGDAVGSIMCATFDPRSIVISNATMGVRPKWNFEHPTPYQMFVPTITAGRPRPIVYGVDRAGDLVELKRNEGRARKRDGEYTAKLSPRSPLDWQNPAPLQIAECRAEYIAWHSSLVSLAIDLAGKLGEYEPTAPAAPAMPWITGEQAASRVIAGRDLTGGDVDFAMAPRRASSVFGPIESPIEAQTIASYSRASRSKMKKPAAAVA